MKTRIIKIGCLFLLLIIMGASCERDDNYDPDSIIGKWKGLYGTSTTLIEDELPRLEGGVVIWTFTKDGCFNISYNGETTFKTDYYVSGIR